MAYRLPSVVMMVYVNLKIIPLPGRGMEIVDALRLQIGPTEVQRGCIQCRLLRDTQEQSAIYYQEEWSSWEELAQHICSERFSRILELMEQSNHMPELSFSDMEKTLGMEYVRKLRKVNAEMEVEK